MKSSDGTKKVSLETEDLGLWKVGGAVSLLRYFRRLAVLLLSLPMVLIAGVPPKDPPVGFPDTHAWISRAIVGCLAIAVNVLVLLPDFSPRLGRQRRGLYIIAFSLLVIGTLIAFPLRSMLIDSH
jgi:hypothetical protein